MKITNALFMAIISIALVGCSSEKKETQVTAPAPPEQIRLLSEADKEKIIAFKNELLDIENVSKKAFALVGDELKLVLKGEKDAFDVASLVDKAKSESGKCVDNLLKEAVPETLPPWFRKNLQDVKNGFMDGYKAKIESFAAVKRFVDEKNPKALLDYRQKEAEANKLLQDARDKLTVVMAATGLSSGKSVNNGKIPD